MAELKPCPFCGGEAKLARHPGIGRALFHEGDDVYSIDCMKCAASAVNRYREDLIVQAWNQRTSTPSRPPAGELTLKEALELATKEGMQAGMKVANEAWEAQLPGLLQKAVGAALSSQAPRREPNDPRIDHVLDYLDWRAGQADRETRPTLEGYATAIRELRALAAQRESEDTRDAKSVDTSANSPVDKTSNLQGHAELLKAANAACQHFYEFNETPEALAASEFGRSMDALEEAVGRVREAQRESEDTRDAERYRWLCANSFDREGVTQVAIFWKTWEPHSQTGEPQQWSQRLRGPALDVFIDTEMARTIGTDTKDHS